MNNNDREKPRKVLTFEDLESVYFNNTLFAGLEAPERLYRLNYPGGRVYYRYTDSGQITTYWGGTTFAEVSMPDINGEFLDRWKLENFLNHQDLKIWMNNKADYGSFQHWQFAKWLRDGKLSHREIENDLLSFMLEKDIPVQVYYNRWIERQKTDLLSLRQWAQDVNFRALSVEFPIWNDSIGVATQIDLLGYVDLPLKQNGEPYASWPSDMSKVKNFQKDVLSIIDLKSKAGASNRGGFHPHEVHQLMTNRWMFNENYTPNGKGPLRIEKVFNLSPKDWENTPTYNFRDQTAKADKLFNAKWNAFCDIWKEDYPKLTEKFWIQFDELSIHGKEDYTRIDLVSAIKARHSKKQKPVVK